MQLSTYMFGGTAAHYLAITGQRYPYNFKERTKIQLILISPTSLAVCFAVSIFWVTLLMTGWAYSSRSGRSLKDALKDGYAIRAIT